MDIEQSWAVFDALLESAIFFNKNVEDEGDANNISQDFLDGAVDGLSIAQPCVLQKRWEKMEKRRIAQLGNSCGCKKRRYC